MPNKFSHGAIGIVLIFQISFLLLLAGYSQPDYGDGYKYKPYAIAIGILIGLLPIFALIGGGIWQITTVRGNIFQVCKVIVCLIISVSKFSFERNKYMRVNILIILTNAHIPIFFINNIFEFLAVLHTETRQKQT